MRKGNKILAGLLVLSTVITANCASLDVEAAKKKLQVKLEKEYTSVTFTLEYSKAGGYDSTVESPSGAKYEVSRVSDTVGTCIVEEPEQGTWNVIIKNPDMDSIPSVKVSASATKPKETDVVKEIQIGKDIAGLKIYFKNDNVVVEWSDDTCGAIKIDVVNLDTQEVLGSEQSSEKKYTCEIPSRAENIGVTVVPSTSSNVSGAAQKFNFKVNHEMNATIKYPEAQYMNTETVPVKVHLDKTYGVQAEVNGEIVLKQEDIKPGDYTFDVSLPEEGSNKIQFFVVDKDGNMRSKDMEYIKDVTPPTLEFDEDYNTNWGKKTINICGTVSNYKTLTLNGKEVNVATDGKFNYECNLHKGKNELFVSAIDDAGNEITETLIVNQTKMMNPKKLLAILIALGTGLFLILKGKRSKKLPAAVEEEENEEETSSEQQTVVYDDDDDEEDD